MRFLLGAVVTLSACCAAQQPLPPKSCVIVKIYQKKAADAWTRWTVPKPYNYVEGDFPKGMKFRAELNAKHVQEIKDKGGQVVVMRSDYVLADLEDARKSCKAFQEAK